MADSAHNFDEDRRTATSQGFPYLQFYRGIFDCAYVALNPFFVVSGKDPRDHVPATLTMNRNELPPGPLSIDLINKIAAEWRTIQTEDPTVTANAEKQLGEPITWETVRNGAGLSTIAEVNRALLTNIGALREPFRSDQAVLDYCSANRIFLPGEDFIQPIVERPLAKLLGSLGQSQTTLSDEFGSYAATIPTQTLIAEERVWRCADIVSFHYAKLYPPDNSWLIFVPYDNFTTVICGQQETLRELPIEQMFEGFWADERIADDWWLTEEERLSILLRQS